MELNHFINQSTQNDIENYLSLKNPPGLILKGIKGLGKEKVGEYIASRLLGCSTEELKSNPDYIQLINYPIKVEDINDMLEACNRNSMGKYRVVFILNAHTMTNITQNRLLKILEDRSSSNILILHTERDCLLSTIESRCYEMLFYPLENLKMKNIMLEIGIEEKYHNFLSFLTENAPFSILENKDVISDYINHYEELSGIKNRKDLLSIFHFIKEKDDKEFYSTHAKFPSYNIRLVLYPFYKMIMETYDKSLQTKGFPNNQYNFEQAVRIMEHGLLHLQMLQQNYTKNDFFNLLRYILQA